MSTDTSIQSQPKSRHKSFDYRTSVRWTGGRGGLLQSDGKPEITVSSPPEFKGEAGRWTPEDLLVASVEICTMTTFVAYALHRKLPLISYESAATGTMEFGEGGYRFTAVTLRPVVVVAAAEEAPRAAEILEEAHRSCFIANSICGRVILEPVIITGEQCSSETQRIPPSS